MMTLGPNNSDFNTKDPSPWDLFMPNAALPSSDPSLARENQAPPSFSSQIPKDISLFSVNDILTIYKHDTELLKHVLAAKAQEDRRKTAEEFRQMEEARLRFRFADIEMEEMQTPTFASVASQGTMASSGAQSPQNISISSFSESSLQARQFYDHQGSPPTQLDLLLASPPPSILDQDFQSMYMMDHTSSSSNTDAMSSLPMSVMAPPQDFNFEVPTTSYSLPSSLSPSFVPTGPFFSQSPNMGYNPTDVISTTSSVSSIESNPLVAELPVRRPEPTNMQHDKISHAASNPGIEKKKSSSKRRQLSTTSLPGFSSSTHVLKWAARKKRSSTQAPMINVNKEPHIPLDHDTVMEALRAKLMRVQSSPSSEQDSIETASPPVTSSPPASSSTPPPPPPPRSPPVDTQPSTGILFLDLKYKTPRRKKSNSVTNDCRYH
ncbi:hypothetical protein BC941DRAFT_439583 [Chlamydoabsidia padenii]|nr:hypothetical protein BC941DRAFT_439583 [Chlamydoabsidia padenii]